jgi:PilZ domain
LTVLTRSGLEGWLYLEDLASVPQISINSMQRDFEMMHRNQNPGTENERREMQRYRINAPITIFIGDREIPAYTRDLSNRGVYFYLALSDCKLIDCDFEFMVELPPEITLSTSCRIRCRGQAIRKEETSINLAGVAAHILDYSIRRDAMAIN